MDTFDAVVIGSGPNGLVAASVLARRGWEVAVLERDTVAGGAVQSAELTVPGYVHDPFSAFYGLLHASPVFSELGLDRSVAWASAPAPVAAAVGPEEAAVVQRDPEETARALAKEHGPDGDAWRELCRWWETIGTRFTDMMLGPIGAPRPALAFMWAARRVGVLR